MFIYAKRFYRFFAIAFAGILICALFLFAKRWYSQADFGRSFGNKATAATQKLQHMQDKFAQCVAVCQTDAVFLQSIVFPEVMRFNNIKDGIEAESLRTLYVQFGEEYANFSIGLFQMKPTFAQQVETKIKQLLPDSICRELQLNYQSTDAETIRMQRVKRLQETDWALVYLTAFVCICNKIYQYKNFTSPLQKLQWYATVYNAGFNKTDAYITQKIKEDNFYLQQNMPEHKFRYAAIAGWFYTKNIQMQITGQ